MLHVLGKVIAPVLHFHSAYAAYRDYAAYMKNGMPMRLGPQRKIESYRVLAKGVSQEHGVSNNSQYSFIGNIDVPRKIRADR